MEFCRFYLLLCFSSFSSLIDVFFYEKKTTKKVACTSVFVCVCVSVCVSVCVCVCVI